ncbi:hypothetical protein AAG906_016776 [Vitis piasezkii]
MTNSSPTRNFRKGKEFCSQVKVDWPVHYSPSIFQWSGGIIEFQWQRQLQSQWISSQAIHGVIQTRKGGNQPP